jgi:PAS domain S-box-containing protein
MSAKHKVSKRSRIGDREQAARGGKGDLTGALANSALIPLILRNARDLIALLDIEGRRIYSSPSYGPLLGDPEKLVGSDSFDDVHPEDRERVRRIYRDTVRTGIGSRTEYRLLARDGTARVVQSEGSAIRDEENRVTGVVVVGRDITNEVRAEIALQESEARFQDCARSSGGWFWENDADGRLTWISDSVERVTGTPVQWFLGKRPQDLVVESEDCSGEAWRLRQQARERREPYRDFRYRLRHPGGELWISNSGVPRFDASGTFLGYRGTTTDVTERKRAEQALAESEARFRSLAELSSDWYWEQDAELRFRSVSEVFFDKSGMSREQVLGKRRWELAAVSPLITTWDAHRAVLEARLPFRDFEYVRDADDGSRHYVSLSGEPVFDAEGRFTGYRGTGRDVTVRRMTHAALQESEDRYRDLVEHSEVLICTHQLDGRIRSVNPWAANVLGYEVAELLNMNIRDVLAPERRPEFDGYIGRLKKDGVASGLMRVQTRTGENRLWKYTNSLRTEGVPAPIVRGMAHDVTEQTRAEQLLAEREELLRVTFDHAPGGISLYDASGRFIKGNRALQSMLGYSEDELRQMTFADIIHPEERSEGLRLREELIAGKRTRTISTRRYLRKDGSFLSARVTVSAVHRGDGSVRYTVGLVEDVTEQLRAEAKLRALSENLAASEAQLRAFMDHSPAPMFIKDRDGRYRMVNPRFLHDFGLAAGQVLGRTDAEIFPRGQAELFLKNDDRVHKLRASIMVEETAWYIDGPHTSIVNKFPILDDKGEIAALGGVASDITERKRMEQVLREQRRLLVRAQDLAGLGYWEYDPATRTMKGSRELRRMLGIARDLPSQTPEWSLDLIHPEDRERVRAIVTRCLEEGANYEIETRVMTPGRGDRIMLISGEAVTQRAGGAKKLIGTCMDITHRRHREQELRDNAEQLQALSRRLVEAQESERHRLAAELHDRVGQNLTALSINLDILAGRMNALDADAKRRLRDSLALLDETALCIEGVLDDLRPPMLQDWGLGPTVQWVAEDFSRRTEIPARVRVLGTQRRIDRKNELALVRIVQEALNNVAKHAHAGKIEVTLGWETDSVRVEVADDGAGFERNATGSPRGLGLVSMRERVQAADGLLEIESAPGKGTRVCALVPG